MSSDVKRYALQLHQRPYGLEQVSAGNLVEYGDYAALEAENAALKHRCGMLGLELENAEERRLQAERQVAILRQHKTDYMEAAEGTRRALEAECERLSQGSKLLIDDLERRDATIEALRAQLAAIQGGMGEEVEVSRWPLKRAHDFLYSHDEVVDAKDHDRLIAQHQRITAAMAAEVQTWKQLHADAQELYADAMIAIGKELGIDVSDEPRCKHVSAQAMAMAAEVERLKAEVTRWHTLACNHSRAEDQLRAELAEVKGREAVATIEQREPYEDGTPNPCKTLCWVGDNAEDDFPAGTKLYTTPPASPDVEGLVKALERISGMSQRNTLGSIPCADQMSGIARTALSTWRQAQEGKA